MRKYIVAVLVLSGVAAAQRLRVPLLHRDPVDAQRAALHEKLTRLAETRKDLGLPEAQPDSSAELDALTTSARASNSRVVHASPSVKSAKRSTQVKSAGVGHPQRAGQTGAATQNAWPPPSQAWTAGTPEPPLGDVARKYRAQKRQAHSSSQH